MDECFKETRGVLSPGATGDGTINSVGGLERLLFSGSGAARGAIWRWPWIASANGDAGGISTGFCDGAFDESKKSKEAHESSEGPYRLPGHRTLTNER